MGANWEKDNLLTWWLWEIIWILSWNLWMSPQFWDWAIYKGSLGSELEIQGAIPLFHDQKHEDIGRLIIFSITRDGFPWVYNSLGTSWATHDKCNCSRSPMCEMYQIGRPMPFRVTQTTLSEYLTYSHLVFSFLWAVLIMDHPLLGPTNLSQSILL